MQAVKHAAASAKEKASNATAKVEEKLHKGKASTNEKVRIWVQFDIVAIFAIQGEP